MKNGIRAFLVIYSTVQALALILFFGAAPYLHLPIKPEEALGVIQLLLPVLSGYLGLILGFYFGKREAEK